MKIDFVDGDDWQGFYKDGFLIAEGHHVEDDLIDFLVRELKIDYSHHFANMDWLYHEGNLPNTFAKVKIMSAETAVEDHGSNN